MGFLGGTFRMPILWALAMLVFHIVAGVAGVYLLAFIVDALAPTFGGQKNFNQAMKLVAYAYTAGAVGAVFGILPYLGVLFALAGALYCIYLLYLGLPKLMKNPAEKTVAYTIVTIVVAIVVGIVLSVVSGLIMAPAMMAGGALGMGASRPSVTYAPDSPMGKLDQFGKKMDEANKRMEAAQKSGDPQKQMEAAMGALGTAMSGGKGVEPLQLDALKPYLPATFAGLPQTSTQSDRSGVPGLMIAKAQAQYGDTSGKSAELEVVDTGGAAGLMGLASWMGIQGEREDASHREVTRKDGNRLVHEEVSKSGGRNKLSRVLAHPLVGSPSGPGVGNDTLQTPGGSLHPGQLAAAHQRPP